MDLAKTPPSVTPAGSTAAGAGPPHCEHLNAGFRLPPGTLSTSLFSGAAVNMPRCGLEVPEAFCDNNRGARQVEENDEFEACGCSNVAKGHVVERIAAVMQGLLRNHRARRARDPADGKDSTATERYCQQR